MKRLGIVAVGLGLVVVAALACTRTVERVAVVTPTSATRIPAPKLFGQEAIGLVQERKAGILSASLRRDFPWSLGASIVCHPSTPKWSAEWQASGKWRVELTCSGAPNTVKAAWTVDDETLRVIPVQGAAD